MSPRPDLLSPKHHDKPRSWRWPKVLGLVVLGIIIVTAPVWVLVARAAMHALDGKEALQAAQAAGERLDLRDADAYLSNAEREFGAATKDLGYLSFLNGLPKVGAQLAAAHGLLDAGTKTISAARDLLSVGEDLISVAQEQGSGEAGKPGSSILLNVNDLAATLHSLTSEQKHSMLAAFATDAHKLREAADKIDTALVAFDAVDPASAPKSISEALEPTRAKLVQLRDGLRTVVPLAETIPSALGYPDAKTYLVFFENNTELRPTGGFLGVVGVAKVQDAELKEMTTGDVYALDGPSEKVVRPKPPAPLTKYLGVPQWYLRDANWSPDFVDSAQTMLKFYHDEAAVALGEKNVPWIDGVIAITPELARDVLAITGPVTVRGVTFSSENVVDELEFQVEKAFVRAGTPFDERKGILNDLADAVAAKVLALPVSGILQVVSVVHTNLTEGHVLLWMHDATLQQIVLDNDWGGKLRDVQDDYLSVIDANLASLKSDPAVAREVAYTITPDGDGYVGTVAITYDHTGSFNWKTTRYRTYTRIYVPFGTEFLGVAGAMENDKIKDPARRPGVADGVDELGRRSFGAFISIEPHERRTLTFRFRLAPALTESIKNGAYSLLVEKQPGTLGNGLTLDLDFGKNVVNAVPGENPSDYGDTRYRADTDLRVDREFTIEL
jgi:hypothetical protein